MKTAEKTVDELIAEIPSIFDKVDRACIYAAVAVAFIVLVMIGWPATLGHLALSLVMCGVIKVGIRAIRKKPRRAGGG